METKLMEDHHVLILGALKKSHVTKYHPMFEDCLQIARIVLLDTHRRFIKEGKDLATFNGYVFQRIYWRITDEVRKEMNQASKYDVDTTEESLAELPSSPQEDLLEVKDILEKLSKCLTDKEALFLEEAYINELSLGEIAKKHHVSRQTVYNWRDRVGLKMLKYY